MNDRIIEIENYWTRVVRDTAEFQQIADAENPEFNTVLKCLYNILKDGFINDLTENGAMRWEKILGLPVAPDATLEERKVQILTYLSIRRPYTWRVLKNMLSAIMGKGNYKLNINNDTSTLTIALASTVDHMRDKVDELCARVIPQNLVIEYDQGLPLDYTRLEFLESTAKKEFIDTLHVPTRSFGYEIKSEIPINGATAREAYFWGCQTRSGADRLWAQLGASGGVQVGWNNPNLVRIVASGGLRGQMVAINFKGSGVFKLDGETVQTLPSLNFTPVFRFFLYASSYTSNNISDTTMPSRFYSAKLSEGADLVRDFIPALDPTGTPCMFDLVTRKPFYNSGTGDFIYPTDAEPVMPLDLDEKFYAKRTEHGIRRLYRVPEGCTMSKDEYAAKNGFKEILEPPMPQKGYWVPEWRETETQLICEWVETEPPTEEGIENE